MHGYTLDVPDANRNIAVNAMHLLGGLWNIGVVWLHLPEANGNIPIYVLHLPDMDRNIPIMSVDSPDGFGTFRSALWVPDTDRLLTTHFFASVLSFFSLASRL
jgi:hypothetical protein